MSEHPAEMTEEQRFEKIARLLGSAVARAIRERPVEDDRNRLDRKERRGV